MGARGALAAGAIAGAIAGAVVALIVAGGPSGIALPAASAPAGTLAPAPPVSPGPAGESAVVGVVQELSPSVVTVVNRRSTGQAQGSGSGFLVDAERGYVVTNSHVVAGGASFDVVFSDDRSVRARLVGHDPETDVAVLEVGRQNVRPLALGDSDAVPTGATVVAIGSALGDFRNSVTVGVVSGKGRRLQSELNPDLFIEDLVQTDAAISPGNSGGPLIWVSAKQVIGVNTLVIRAAGSEGLGFAVSSNTVRQIADELVKTGRVERGRIGIAYQPLTVRDAQARGLPEGGALVTDVVAGSPAASAGLQPADLITRVNDQRIDLEHPLQTIMLRYRPGDRVSLTVVRGGREMVVEVTLGRPS